MTSPTHIAAPAKRHACAAVTALFAFAVVISARAETLGNYGVGHAEMHHWYETLRDSKGRQCCSGRDCRPTQSRLSSGRIEVLVDGLWTPIPPEKILPETSPDLRTHVCAPPRPNSYPLGFVFCVVLPPSS